MHYYSKKYNDYSVNYGIAKLLLHSKIIRNSLSDFKSKNDFNSMYALNNLGLFIFHSILNGAERNQQISFNTHEGFILGICSFACEEDMVLEYIEIENYVKSNNSNNPDKLGISYINDILPRLNKQNVSILSLRNELNTYFNSTSRGWPDGGQCGCCGNYEGPCVYWSLTCLAHDMACQQCQHWWCFSGCGPTSCRGNTLPWYKFLSAF